MKLFKKVLAVALSGVLALTVLTGCNNSNSVATVKMLDALNDWAKVYGEDTTFEKDNKKPWNVCSTAEFNWWPRSDSNTRPFGS